MKIYLRCNECGTKFTQDVEYISMVNWICPRCKIDEHTFIIGTDCKPEPLGIGRGGCGADGFK